jgi:hypothetical protein
MSPAQHLDCLGHAHEQAPSTDSIVGNEEHPNGNEPGGDCCKTPSCGCGCVGTNVSVAPTKDGLTLVVDHGFVVPTDVDIYDSPVLHHLIRPPILQALHAP